MSSASFLRDKLGDVNMLPVGGRKTALLRLAVDDSRRFGVNLGHRKIEALGVLKGRWWSSWDWGKERCAVTGGLRVIKRVVKTNAFRFAVCIITEILVIIGFTTGGLIRGFAQQSLPRSFADSSKEFRERQAIPILP